MCQNGVELRQWEERKGQKGIEDVDSLSLRSGSGRLSALLSRKTLAALYCDRRCFSKVLMPVQEELTVRRCVFLARRVNEQNTFDVVGGGSPSVVVGFGAANAPLADRPCQPIAKCGNLVHDAVLARLGRHFCCVPLLFRGDRRGERGRG